MAAFLQQERDAVVIKIADRLHNLQTASVLTHPYQERVANVGLNLLVPLADRLGMGIARRQMETIALKLPTPCTINCFCNSVQTPNSIRRCIARVAAGI